MATEEMNGPMSTQLDPDRPLPDTVRSALSKPQGGARVLSFVLQALVMAIALFLFFLFAGVAAIVLSHLFVAGRTLRQRRSLSSSPNHSRTFFNQEDLKKLPSFDYSTTTSTSDCAICLENFRVGDKCRSLGLCGHEFHRDCVDRWLEISVACPICRRGVV